MARKEYEQEGSMVGTTGRLGTGTMDDALSAARKRNKALAEAAGEQPKPEETKKKKRGFFSWLP
jgi:hypothetical protein